MAKDPGIVLEIKRGSGGVKEAAAEEVTESITFSTASEQEGDSNEAGSTE